MATLSVLCITNDPGPQIAAILRPLRGVADEIVVAADASVDDATLATYAGVADRLVTYSYAPPFERALAWAHAQCTGDWVLRLDGDELVSPELVEQLPALLERTDRVQYWFPRRWVFPDGAAWIDERPWAPDFQLRLVRNDPSSLAFPGTIHSSAHPAEPMEFRPEPLLHLDLLLRPVEERRAKAARYAEHQQGLRAPGGGPLELVYAPEDALVSEPLPLPAAEREAVERCLAELREATAPTTTTVDRAALRHGARDDVDAHWEARGLADADLAATIEVLDTDLRLGPSAPEALTLQVTNRGTAIWPGGLDRHPLVRLGYRWLTADGTPIEGDTGRSALRSAVAPGETVIALLGVMTPPEPGRYIVEVDLLVENGPWFGAALQIPLRISERDPRPQPATAGDDAATGEPGAAAEPQAQPARGGWRERLRRG